MLLRNYPSKSKTAFTQTTATPRRLPVHSKSPETLLISTGNSIHRREFDGTAVRLNAVKDARAERSEMQEMGNEKNDNGEEIPGSGGASERKRKRVSRQD